MQIPEIDENTPLKDLIGRDSLPFFELLLLANLFLREVPNACVGTENYTIFEKMFKKRQRTNDVTERVLGMATSHNSSSVPKNFGTERDLMRIIQN